MKNILISSGNQKKEEVVVLTLDKIEFKSKNVHKKQRRSSYNDLRVNSPGSHNNYNYTRT